MGEVVTGPSAELQRCPCEVLPPALSNDTCMCTVVHHEGPPAPWEVRLVVYNAPVLEESLVQLLDFLDAFMATKFSKEGFSICYDIRQMRRPKVDIVRRIAAWGREPAREQAWKTHNKACKVVVTPGLMFTLCKTMLKAFFKACPPVVRTYLLTDPDQPEQGSVYFDPVDSCHSKSNIAADAIHRDAEQHHLDDGCIEPGTQQLAPTSSSASLEDLTSDNFEDCQDTETELASAVISLQTAVEHGKLAGLPTQALGAILVCLAEEQNRVLNIPGPLVRDPSSADVHHRNLRCVNCSDVRLKICLYAPGDKLQWVPLGGLAGPGVATLVPQEHVYLSPPGGQELFLKVFRPAFFDQPLYGRLVQRGRIIILREESAEVVGS